MIDSRLRYHALSKPNEQALMVCAPGRSPVWTWCELEATTARPASAMAAAAARPGRSVLLLDAGNDERAVPELVAALRTELPVALLAASAPEAQRLALRDTLLRCGYDVISMVDLSPALTRSPAPAPAPLPADATLLTTGGSSGRPKLVVDRWMRGVGRRPPAVRPSSVMRWRAGQRQLVLGPLHHAAPLTAFVEGLSDGNTLIVASIFDPALVLATIEACRVEWLQLTPYHMRRLAGALRQGNHDLSSVRGMLHQAAPCPDPLKRRWLDLLEPSRVFELYGATEGVGITIASGEQWLRRPGTVGKGFFTRIRILDGSQRTLPVGEVGEVYLRSGPATRRHYVDADDGVRTTIDGYASVGDHGRCDADGYLYLAHRQLTRIQVGGETVDPSEVESVLGGHPQVLDAAVLGVPDERLGEAVIALVVAEHGADPRALRHYLRERMARHKVPRLVRLVSELPYTDAGKLDRNRLEALAGQEPGGQP